MRQMTFQEYRNTDLLILTIMTVIFEGIATLASGRWFYAQPIAISITLLLVCITVMRWNGYALLVAVIGGATYCFASGAKPEQYLIYCIGNAGALLVLLLLKTLGKETIRGSYWLIVLMSAVGYVGMGLGRWLISLMFGADPKTLVAFLATDIITFLFAAVVLCLISKTEGMLEDQKAYLLRLEKERQEEHDFEENDIIL